MLVPDGAVPSTTPPWIIVPSKAKPGRSGARVARTGGGGTWATRPGVCSRAAVAQPPRAMIPIASSRAPTRVIAAP